MTDYYKVLDSVLTHHKQNNGLSSIVHGAVVTVDSAPGIALLNYDDISHLLKYRATISRSIVTDPITVDTVGQIRDIAAKNWIHGSAITWDMTTDMLTNNNVVKTVMRWENNRLSMDLWITNVSIVTGLPRLLSEATILHRMIGTISKTNVSDIVVSIVSTTVDSKDVEGLVSVNICRDSIYHNKLNDGRL